MISRKISIAIVILSVSLLAGIPMIWLKYKKPAQQETIVAGLTEGQQKTFQQDLSGAMSQYGHIKKGDRLFNKGNFDDAIKEYETALSLARSSGSKGEAYRHLANAYEKKRDYQKALDYIVVERDRYMAEWAKEPLVERARYLAYAIAGDYDRAIEYAEKAIVADAKVHNSSLTRQDYQGRLDDLIASKEYILSLKKYKYK